MRRCLLLPMVALSMLVSAGSFSQTSRQLLDTKKIFITSSFDCPVFWGNKRIAILRKGTTARLLTSTRKWILVRFWSNERHIIGWIRR